MAGNALQRRMLASWQLGRRKKEKKEPSQVALVVHTCNPSYSGGRDQDDRGSKPAQKIV
jgi:hypothetical protein